MKKLKKVTIEGTVMANGVATPFKLVVRRDGKSINGERLTVLGAMADSVQKLLDAKDFAA